MYEQHKTLLLLAVLKNISFCPQQTTAHIALKVSKKLAVLPNSLGLGIQFMFSLVLCTMDIQEFQLLAHI